MREVKTVRVDYKDIRGLLHKQVDRWFRGAGVLTSSDAAAIDSAVAQGCKGVHVELGGKDVHVMCRKACAELIGCAEADIRDVVPGAGAMKNNIISFDITYEMELEA